MRSLGHKSFSDLPGSEQYFHVMKTPTSSVRHVTVLCNLALQLQEGVSFIPTLLCNNVAVTCI